MKVHAPTWVQRNVSPIANRLFGTVFVRREALHWAVNFVADKLNHYQAEMLRSILVRFEIIQYKFKDLKLDELRPYHFSKVVDKLQLHQVCQMFAEKCDLPDFILNVHPAIIGIKPFNEVKLDQPLKAIEPIEHDKTGQNVVQERLLKQAREMALSLDPTAKEVLEYRENKLDDMGADVSAKIAAFFMDVPVAYLKVRMITVKGDRLAENAEMIVQTVGRYQQLAEKFSFDSKEMVADEKYLYHKMFELVFLAEKPDALLLYFLRKLKDARTEGARESRIFDEIRFLLAPLAERLGLIYLADDYRDQFMRVNYPKTYADINELVCNRFKMRDYAEIKNYLSGYVKQLRAFFERWMGPVGKGLVIKFRAKSPYSIWNKTELRKERSFNELQDILGIKIITDDITNIEMLKARLLERNNYFQLGKNGIREDLRPVDLEATWRGVKMQGQNEDEMAVEIQIEDENIHWNNMYGKVATWWYNLQKELGGIVQVLGRVEPHDTFKINYNDNFYRIRDFCVTAIAKFSNR